MLPSCSQEVMSEDALCRIYFLDVGQGDCTLIRTRKGDILIDAGPESAQDALCLRLKQLGVKEIALAVFTQTGEQAGGFDTGQSGGTVTDEIFFGHRHPPDS